MNYWTVLKILKVYRFITRYNEEQFQIRSNKRTYISLSIQRVACIQSFSMDCLVKSKLRTIPQVFVQMINQLIKQWLNYLIFCMIIVYAIKSRQKKRVSPKDTSLIPVSLRYALQSE